MRKKQNTGRSIAQSIHRIYASGLFVTAGFIIGFDSETESAAEAMIELIEEAAIPVCMVGLLYALPHTQLERRLEKEGRLFPHPERKDLKTADQCTMGLNFKTVRPRQEVLADYAYILERIYDPVAYAGRLQRLAGMLDNSGRKRRTRAAHSRRKLGSLEMLHRIMTNLPEPREIFRNTLSQCILGNPDSIRWVVALMALYLHVGPFSRDVIARIENIMATLEPPSALGTTLRVEHIVHAGDGERDDRCRISARRRQDRRPKFGLQLSHSASTCPMRRSPYRS
jgi:hypothetical protein